ncbi:hypothetical protein C8R43DRAFT_905005, partial [Mycena crocata]
EERGPILEWISSSNVTAKHSSILRVLQPGTGEWLLKTELFTTWLSGSGQALWLSGIPGAGKTVLASLVIEQLHNIQQDQPASCIGLAWVYNDYKEAKLLPDDIFLCIARQLAALSPAIYNHFKSAHREDPHKPLGL